MILAFLLAAASGPTALDAERAFAADARTLGQWSAFRKWAASDATMFVPQPTNAQTWLKDRKDPAHAIEWWPTASYVSCDGSIAVNTGGWKRPDSAVGYFSTVWQRQQDGGWKWIVDSGDDLKVAPPGGAVRIKKASCKEALTPHGFSLGTDGGGKAFDRSVIWYWTVLEHVRSFTVEQWDGRQYKPVINDLIVLSK